MPDVIDLNDFSINNVSKIKLCPKRHSLFIICEIQVKRRDVLIVTARGHLHHRIAKDAATLSIL